MTQLQGLKGQLVQSLYNSGIIDSLKAQVRAKLIAQLSSTLKTSPTIKAAPSDTYPQHLGPLFGRVVNSIIFEYLEQHGFEYTLSVFMPESGISSHQLILDESEIMDALHLQSSALIMQGLQESAPSSSSFLIKLLSALARSPQLGSANRDEICQTEQGFEDIFVSRMLDVRGSSLCTSHHQHVDELAAIQHKFTSFQVELEAKLHRAMTAQLSHYKETEIAQMRLEERKTFALQLANAQAEHAEQLAQANNRAREEVAADRNRLQTQQREQEAAHQTLTIQLLERAKVMELEAAKIKSEAEFQHKALELENALLTKKYDQSCAQIVDLQSWREKISKDMHEELARHKIKIGLEHSTLLSDAQVERTRLQGEKLLLEEKQATLDRLLASAHETREVFQQSKQQIADYKHQVALLTSERDKAVLGMKELSLFVNTQASTSALEWEISSLKKKLIETEKSHNVLFEELKKQKPQSETLLTAGLSSEDAEKLKQSVTHWQNQCAQLLSKLEAELNKSEALELKVEDQKIALMEREREVADLRLYLHQTQTALNARTSVLDVSPTIYSEAGHFISGGVSVMSQGERRNFSTGVAASIPVTVAEYYPSSSPRTVMTSEGQPCIPQKKLVSTLPVTQPIQAMRGSEPVTVNLSQSTVVKEDEILESILGTERYADLLFTAEELAVAQSSILGPFISHADPTTESPVVKSVPMTHFDIHVEKSQVILGTDNVDRIFPETQVTAIADSDTKNHVTIDMPKETYVQVEIIKEPDLLLNQGEDPLPASVTIDALITTNASQSIFTEPVLTEQSEQLKSVLASSVEATPLVVEESLAREPTPPPSVIEAPPVRELSPEEKQLKLLESLEADPILAKYMAIVANQSGQSKGMDDFFGAPPSVSPIIEITSSRFGGTDASIGIEKGFAGADWTFDTGDTDSMSVPTASESNPSDGGGW